jgi:hypothetical protein
LKIEKEILGLPAVIAFFNLSSSLCKYFHTAFFVEFWD